MLPSTCPLASLPRPLPQIHVEPYSNTGPLHPGFCRDNNAKCPEWAALGECERNVVFMRGNGTYRGHCRLSCKVCQPCAANDEECLQSNLRPAERGALRQGAAGGMAAAK